MTMPGFFVTKAPPSFEYLGRARTEAERTEQQELLIDLIKSLVGENELKVTYQYMVNRIGDFPGEIKSRVVGNKVTIEFMSPSWRD